MHNPQRPGSERAPLVLIGRGAMEAHFSMEEAIACMSDAFASLAAGTCLVPGRYVSDSPDGAMTLLVKPAFASDLDTTGIKVLSQKNRPQTGGLPSITGVMLLMDRVTGELLSILDGEYLTALRTGAASGLATRLLSREDSRTLVLFGGGSQGRTQLEAVCAVRDIRKIWVFDHSEERAELFINEMREKVSGELEIARDLSVLKKADVICTATPSHQPLFGRAELGPGVHINAIGSFRQQMQELDPDLFPGSLTYVDDLEGCMKSGDLAEAVRKLGDPQKWLAGSIGELVLGKVAGRTSPEEMTLFKSVGTAIQDLVVADRIYRKSRNMHFGEETRLYE